MHVWRPSSRVEHGIGCKRLAVGELYVQPAAGSHDAAYIGIHPHIYAVLAHFTGGEVTDVIIEAAQDLFAAIKLDDVGAEAVEDGRELAGDVAAAYDHQPGRKDWQVKHLVGRHHMLAPDDLRHLRPATGSDQNAFGTKLLITDHNGVGIKQGGPTAHHMHLRQQPFVDAIQPQDFPGAVGLQRLPVESRVAYGPAKTTRLDKGFAEVCGIAVKLLRNATEIDAGATHCGGFCQRDAGTALGCHACGAHTTTAATDDE